MNWKIPLADLDFDSAEEDAVQRVLRSRWLTMGAESLAFESEFSEFVGAKHAIAVSNCTVALHLAYEVLSIGSDDEVIVPSLTFVATANAVKYTGATPIFVDIASEYDFSISPDDIEAKITPRTKAIVAVHYGGYACDMERICELGNRYGLHIIEDAAHTPGSYLNDRQLGTWGKIGCFSFFSNKNLATGEGGMLVTDDDELARKLRLMRSHGMTSLTWDRHQGHAFSYDVVEAGYNYRIDEIRSAIGRVQLSKLTNNNARRRVLNQLYLELLPDEIGVPYKDHRGVSSCHIRPILLPHNTNRHAFMQAMKAQGIQTSIHYPPVHWFSYYKGSASLPITESVTQREVTLPLFPTMTDETVRTVTHAIRSALTHA